MKEKCPYCKQPASPCDTGMLGLIGLCRHCKAPLHVSCAIENKGCPCCGEDPGFFPKLPERYRREQENEDVQEIYEAPQNWDKFFYGVTAASILFTLFCCLIGAAVTGLFGR